MYYRNTEKQPPYYAIPVYNDDGTLILGFKCGDLFQCERCRKEGSKHGAGADRVGVIREVRAFLKNRVEVYGSVRQLSLSLERRWDLTGGMMSELEIVSGYIPGSLGRVVSLHGTYYHEHWGFGLFFEVKVATELTAFLSTFDPARDGFWTVSSDGEVQGTITIDGSHGMTEGAHLRWFITSDTMRGQGLGKRLLSTAMEFCRECGYPRVYLWTFGGLGVARHLYERHGFVLTEEHRGTQWGTEVLEQRMECDLNSFQKADREDNSPRDK
jgi:GNAT superfamily N-acetyltransferase